ncbi:MAG TPA: PQQ-binding-like beta-propeller repeat protein [Gemmataceae bacterium]|jgi:outer membrane protein assembly factor BamB|nr:PQQ-binding-like beta-propeller repeat protein [Gemmataceae bacterium]
MYRLLSLVAVVAIALPIRADDKTDDFFAAVRRGDVRAVETLLDKGVDPKAKTAYGATGLHFAADKGNVEMAKLLLKRKADPNAADTFYGATPLMWASMNNHAGVLAELLAGGATGGEGLLRSAAADGKVDMVKAILAHAKPTVEQLTAARGVATKDDVIDLLTKAGAHKPEKKATAPTDDLKAFIGTYRNAEAGDLTVDADGGSLAVSLGGKKLFTLIRDKDDVFKIEGNEATLTFTRKDGKITGFTVKAGKGNEQAFARVDPKAVAKKDAVLPDVAEPTEKVTKPLNWPQFRGTGATGVADGQYPPTSFDVPKNKNVRWKTPIPGLGHSCPVVWEDRIFITTAVSGDPKAGIKPGQYGDVESVKDDTSHKWFVICLDKKTGNVIWQKEACAGVPKIKRHLKGTHANPTVATDGTHVVVSFGAEGLYCYDRDGNLKWKRDLGNLDSGWFYNPDYQWGFGSSPIIHEDRTIVQCDVGKNSFIAAYSLADGKPIWQTPRDEIPSWGTPTIVVGPERTELVTNSTKFVRGYDPKTGSELWKLGKNAEITVPTPFLAKGLIWITSGYRPIQPIYAIKPGATGDISLKDKETSNASIAWSKAKGGPYMPTPIVYGDYLYTCANNGLLTCYEAATGKQMYAERLGGADGFTASPVAADGRLYFTGEENGVRVVKAGPKYQMLAINPLGETCLATPAIADGLLLVRTEHHLVALGRAEK